MPRYSVVNRHLDPLGWTDIALRMEWPDRCLQPLSRRERECLLWASMGLAHQEVATTLGLAESTVAEYVGKSIETLKAQNRTHAVSRAFALRLIDP